MSFDPENFAGLSKGGDPGAPIGSHELYVDTITSFDPEGEWGGDTFFTCFDADHVDSISCRGETADHHSIDRDPADLLNGADAFGDLTTPPDYFTVRIDCGGPGTDAVEFSGFSSYFTSCGLEGLFDGPSCEGEVSPSFNVEAVNTAGGDTFVPDTGPLDGDGVGLAGYIAPSSPVYTGNPSNTASDLLWAAADVATLRFQFISGNFHIAFVAGGGLTFTIRPFWKQQTFVCLV